MAKITKKAKKQLGICALLFAFLALCSGIENYRAKWIMNQRGVVLNRSPILFCFREIESVKTDGSSVFLLTSDHYVIMLNRAGEKERQFFPCANRFGIGDDTALAVNQENDTLLFYTPGASVKEFTKAGILLHRFEADSLDELSGLPRFSNMQLANALEKEMQCILSDGTVFEVRSCFLPVQWVVRTVGSESRLLYLFPTVTVDEILTYYGIACFVLFEIILRKSNADMQKQSAEAAVDTSELRE